MRNIKIFTKDEMEITEAAKRLNMSRAEVVQALVDYIEQIEADRKERCEYEN